MSERMRRLSDSDIFQCEECGNLYYGTHGEFFENFRKKDINGQMKWVCPTCHGLDLCPWTIRETDNNG